MLAIVVLEHRTAQMDRSAIYASSEAGSPLVYLWSSQANESVDSQRLPQLPEDGVAALSKVAAVPMEEHS